MEENKRIALLIDSDNMNATYARTIFNELVNYGIVTISRVYGDFSSEANTWKRDVLLAHSITPVQQFAYTTKKNATDMKMVIDAMDILHEGKSDIVCLVTNDSDFTPIAARLREDDIYVIGMGTSQASKALQTACNKFVYLNLITEDTLPEENKTGDTVAEVQEKADSQKAVTSLKTIKSYVNTVVNDSDELLISLGVIGTALSKKFNDYDTRNYGYSKLSTMIKATMTHLKVVAVDNNYYIQKNNASTREKIDAEIRQIIKDHGGKIGNLSIINDELKKTHKGFKPNQFGYSRFSTFLKNVDGITVDGNKVSLKK